MNDNPSKNKILSNIQRAKDAHHTDNKGLDQTLPVYKGSGSIDNEFDRLLHEIELVSGKTARIKKDCFADAFTQLVDDYQIQSAMMWQTEYLKSLRIADILMDLGIKVVSPYSELFVLSKCDLGITEVDYAVAESGSLVLVSSPEKPRIVSLLPRVHLAFLKPSVIWTNLHLLINELKNHHYAVFITGPSRTADIELTVSLGVHGPQSLLVWTFETE
jgi:L-lactate dehydrogenase complex protein LldG